MSVTGQRSVHVTRVFDTYVHVSDLLSSLTTVQEGRGVGCRVDIVCNLRQLLYRVSTLDPNLS